MVLRTGIRTAKEPMENGTTAAGRRKALRRSDITNLLTAANEMPKKSQTIEQLNVKEAVAALLPALRKLRSKGYSYQDIAQWLISNGMAASEDTITSKIGEVLREARRAMPAPGESGRQVRAKATGRTGSRPVDKPAALPVVQRDAGPTSAVESDRVGSATETSVVLRVSQLSEDV
jgi:hypothetical protein